MGAIGSVFLRFLLYSNTPNIVMNHIKTDIPQTIDIVSQMCYTMNIYKRKNRAYSMQK